MQTLIFKIKCYKEWLSMNKNAIEFNRKVEIPKHLKFFIQDNLIKISSNIFSAQSVVEEEKSPLEIKEICSFIVSEERKFQGFWADVKKMLWEHHDGISSSREMKTSFNAEKQSNFIIDISKKVNQLMDIGIDLSNKLIAQMKHIKDKKPDKNTMQILKSTLQNNLQSSQRSVIFPDLNIKKQDSFIQNYVIPEQSPNQVDDMVFGRFITEMDSTSDDCETTKVTEASPTKKPLKNQSNNRLKRLVQQTIDKAHFDGFNFEKKKRYNYFYGQCSFENPQLNKKQQIIKSADKINQRNQGLETSQADFYIPQHKNTEQKIKDKIRENMKQIKNNHQKAERIAQKLTAQYVRVNYRDTKKPSFLSPKPIQIKICDELAQVKCPFNEKKQINFNSPKQETLKINIISAQQDKQNPELFKKNGKRAQSIDISNQSQEVNQKQQKKIDDTSQKANIAEKKKLFIQRLANIDEYAKATLSMYKPEEKNSHQSSNDTKEGHQNEVQYKKLDINIFQTVNSQLFTEQNKRMQDFTNKNSVIIIDDILGSWESHSQISFGAQ